MTKTIVVGKDPTLVRQLLYILSYFIRCSEIKEYSLKMQMHDEFDSFSLRNSDHVSCCSDTPTNTPSMEMWSNFGDRKENISVEGNRNMKGKAGSVNKNGAVTDNEKGKAFEDPEEICNCMCSVLQSIDYIGSKGLRNIKMLKNAMKIDKQVEGTAAKKVKENGQRLINGYVPDKKELSEYSNKYPSFRCYCCPEKHSFRSYIETAGKMFPRQNSGDSVDCNSAEDESKSCVCGDKETSEYGSETRSNQCTLSRNSSCGSCSDYFRKSECRSQDLDSDYCSIANEEHGIEGNGIELDLQDIKSEKGEDDELMSMNLMELPMPE